MINDLTKITFSKGANRAHQAVRFFSIACGEVPGILESLKGDVFPTFEQFFAKLKKGEYEEGVNSKYSPKYMEIYNLGPGNAEVGPPFGFSFYHAYSPSVTHAVVAWAKKWNLCYVEGTVYPFMEMGTQILGSWCLSKEYLDECRRPDFLFCPALDELALDELALDELALDEKEVPSHLKDYLKDFTYRANYELFAGMMTRKQLENFLTKRFRKDLALWLDMREKYDYETRLSPKKKIRADNREEYFKWLSHLMILERPVSEIIEQFDESERNVRRGINKACELLGINRDSLYYPPGRRRKNTAI